MRRVTTALLSTVVMAAGLGTAAAPSGAAIAGISLAGFTDMAVDEAHGNVLVTSGAASSQVTVLSLAGVMKSPVTGMPDAQDVRLAADGTEFYLSLRSERAIGVIDAVTLAQRRISLGDGVCPTSVAQQGAVLWFTSTDCTDSGAVDLGTVSLADGTVTTGLAPEGLVPNRVETSPALEGAIVVRGSTRLAVLDVTGGATTAPTVRALVYGTYADLAITPDGLEVLSSRDIGGGSGGLSTADLSTRTSYLGGDSDAVATRPDGLVAFAHSEAVSTDVYLYRAGTVGLWRAYNLTGTARAIVDRGLEFGATDLYAIGVDGANHWAFYRTTPLKASRVTLTRVERDLTFGATARLTAHLDHPGVVSIYAQPYNGTKRLLKRGAVDSRGNLTASIPVYWRTTFTAVSESDDTYDVGVSPSTFVTVTAKVTSTATRVVGTSGSYRLVRSGSRPSVVTTVQPKHAGQCVRYQIQQADPNSWTGWAYRPVTGCYYLDRYSRHSVVFDSSWPPGVRVRVKAMWSGDTRNEATKGPWVYLKFVR